MAMEEGTVLRWVKNVGDKVSIGDELLEIETDKVNMMVEADAEGYLLKILNGPGDVVPVIQTIAYIGDSMDEAIPGDAASASAFVIYPSSSIRRIT